MSIIKSFWKYVSEEYKNKFFTSIKDKLFVVFQNYTQDELKDIDMKEIVKFLSNIESLLESFIEDKEVIS